MMGTTTIQANDFIGHKLVSDQGAVAKSQISAMRNTAAELQAQDGTHAEALYHIAQHLECATHDYESAIAFVIGHVRDNTRGVYAGSVSCLMLAGTVHSGWQLGRAALAASQAIARGETDLFYRAKIATAVNYAVYVLPRTQALRSAVEGGLLVDHYTGQT